MHIRLPACPERVEGPVALDVATAPVRSLRLSTITKLARPSRFRNDHLITLGIF
jgi:hypothetical protein